MSLSTAEPSLFHVPSKQLRKCLKFEMKDPSSTTQPFLLPLPLPLGHCPTVLISRLLEQTFRSLAPEPNDPVPTHTLPFPSCEALAAAVPSCLLVHAQNWDSSGVCAL